MSYLKVYNKSDEKIVDHPASEKQYEPYISFFQYSWHGIRDLQGRLKYKPYRRRALTTHYALLKSA